MIYTIGSIPDKKGTECGAKAMALDSLGKRNIPVPRGKAIGTDVYRSFVEDSGLQASISLALEEKPLEQMRWEEIWDLSQKIRLHFLKTPLPPAVQKMLLDGLADLIDRTLVIRSSSIFEDTRGSSFAGLHDSLVNVRGEEAVLNVDCPEASCFLVVSNINEENHSFKRKEAAGDPGKDVDPLYEECAISFVTV